MSQQRRLCKRRELRVIGDGAKLTIGGYAAVFDSESDLLGGWFVEVIRRGAFKDSLATNPDVRCLFNHDAGVVLGRTKSGTLRLKEDNVGLYMECDLPDTQAARDLAESIRRGDVDQQSFAFDTVKDRWTYEKDYSKPALRELITVDLFDVSPVTYPAYQQTDVALRSMELGDDDLIRKARLEWEQRAAAADDDLVREIEIAAAGL